MYTNENHYEAERIGPFCFKLPQKFSAFLSTHIICTILPNTLLGCDFKDDEGTFTALIPLDKWLNNILPRIESLSSNSAESRRVQRLAVGYSSELQCINSCIDLSSLTSIIEYSVKHGCLHDGDLLLSMGENSIRLIVPE